MTQELKFKQIKDEVKGLIEETLKNNLDVEYVDSEQQQKVNDTIAEINQKLHSTYPGYKFFQEEKTKEKMQNILRAFSNYYTEICYYQGMNFIRKK